MIQLVVLFCTVAAFVTGHHHEILDKTVAWETPAATIRTAWAPAPVVAARAEWAAAPAVAVATRAHWSGPAVVAPAPLVPARAQWAAAAAPIVAAPAPVVAARTEFLAAPAPVVAARTEFLAAPVKTAAVAVPAAAIAVAPAPAVAVAAAPAFGTVLEKNVHYENRPVVTGYTSTIHKPDLGHLATPLNTVSQTRVAAPARAVDTVIPHVTRVEPELHVQKVPVDVPVKTPFVSEVEVRTPIVKTAPVAVSPIVAAPPAPVVAAAPAPVVAAKTVAWSAPAPVVETRTAWASAPAPVVETRTAWASAPSPAVTTYAASAPVVADAYNVAAWTNVVGARTGAWAHHVVPDAAPAAVGWAARTLTPTWAATKYTW